MNVTFTLCVLTSTNTCPHAATIINQLAELPSLLGIEQGNSGCATQTEYRGSTEYTEKTTRQGLMS